MSKREILAGLTDQTIDVFIQDSSSSVGAGLTGLVYNTASLVCYYRKGATGTPTALTLATQTVGGAHSDGGFVAVDGTNCPGQYRLDLSDTIIATAGMVTVYLRGAANMVPCVVEIEAVSVNKFDAVRGGLTALPNANAEAAGGLYTRGTGAGQINQEDNGYISVNLKSIIRTVLTETSSGYLAAAFKKLFDVATPVLTSASVNQTADNNTILANGTYGNSALQVLLAAIKAKTDNLPSDPADASDIVASFASITSTLSTIASYIDTEIAAIKAKTDNLPSDPADASDIAGLLASITSSLTTIASYIDTEVAAIKAKTDNLPSDPADASDIAATLSTIIGYIDTEVAAIKAKTDNLPSDPADASDIATSFASITTLLGDITAYIDTEVAAIKAKTDNLPSDPADASDIASVLTTIASYIDTEVAAIKAKTDALPSDPADASDIAASFTSIAATLSALSSALSAVPSAATNASAVRTELAPELSTISTISSTLITFVAKFTGITLVANWLRLLGRKTNNDATALTEFNSDTGVGTGAYAPTTDALEAIRDRGDAAWTTGSGGGGGGSAAGPGADQCTQTITDEDDNPIADADVWISIDAEGQNVVAGTLQTNSAGEIMFLLDEGVTYYLWMQKDGVNAIRGQSFVAEAD